MKLKRLIIGSLLLGMFSLFHASLPASDLDSSFTVEKTAVVYQQKRPFSWYYPYRFQYYYPRKGYDSCYWIYTNGSYVYQCS